MFGGIGGFGGGAPGAAGSYGGSSFTGGGMFRGVASPAAASAMPLAAGGQAPPESEGLAVWMAQEAPGPQPGVFLGAGGAPQDATAFRRDQQALMPVTIRMIETAHEEMIAQNPGGVAADAVMRVHGREVAMLTLVAYLESASPSNGGEVYKGYMLNDGSGRIEAKMYLSEADTGVGAEPVPKPGQYVRVFGTCRSWNSKLHITAQRVQPVQSANEVPFHAIEVAHTFLRLEGLLSKPAAVSGHGAGQSSQRAATDVPGPASAWIGRFAGRDAPATADGIVASAVAPVVSAFGCASSMGGGPPSAAGQGLGSWTGVGVTPAVCGGAPAGVITPGTAGSAVGGLAPGICAGPAAGVTAPGTFVGTAAGETALPPPGLAVGRPAPASSRVAFFPVPQQPTG